MNFNLHIQISDSYFSGNIVLAREQILKSDKHLLKIEVTRRTTMHFQYEANWWMYNTKNELLAEGRGALKCINSTLTAQFWFPAQSSA